MLVNISIGKDLLGAKWYVIEDEYGAQYYVNQYINQRMRIDKRLNVLIPISKSVENKTISDELSAEYSTYDMPEESRFVCNNKNLNAMILASNKYQKTDQHIIYITIGSEYKLLSNISGNLIMQSYHMKDYYQGCCVIVKDKNKTDRPITRVLVKSLKDNKFYQFTITVDDSCNVSIDVTSALNKEVLTKLRSLDKKTKPIGFKLKVQPKQLLTYAYFVSPEAEEKVRAAASEMSKTEIVVIDPKMSESEAYDLIVSTAQRSNIRAVTFSGTPVNFKACKDSRILYIFDYDYINNEIHCVKSN